MAKLNSKVALLVKQTRVIMTHVIMSMVNLPMMSMLSLMMGCHKVTECTALQPWAFLEGAPEPIKREAFAVQQLINSFFQSASFTTSLLALE